MKRFRIPTYHESEYGEDIHMVENEKGEYCLYSEANAVIGDLRRRLEDANGKLRANQGYPNHFRPGYDERKFN